MREKEKKDMINYLKQFLKEEDGVGVVEIILILLVLVGLVVIFKAQLTDIIGGVFDNIRKSVSGL